MKLVTFNCNGIRSAIRKGLFTLVDQEEPDVLLLQEAKSPVSEVSTQEWLQRGYQIHSCIAEKPGYSGVFAFSKVAPLSFQSGYGEGIFRTEGRSLLLEFSEFFLWNLYFPSGTSGETRQKEKMKFLDAFQELVTGPERPWKKKPLVVACDLNIAHTENDIHNPKSNKNSSGFLPEEREWLTQFLALGFADTYRSLYPEKVEYTWWTYRQGAREKNKGWRIDYFLVDKSLLPRVKSAKILSQPLLSDHAPLCLEGNFH